VAIRHGQCYDECCEDGMESSVRWNLPNLGALDLADCVEDFSTTVTDASSRGLTRGQST
jgi:hypothetical protein